MTPSLKAVDRPLAIKPAKNKINGRCNAPK